MYLVVVVLCSKKKCLKKSTRMIFFLDTACYCLDIDADFACFQRECFKQKKYTYIFIIHDWTQKRSKIFPVKFIACCKRSIDHQIDLFVKENSFPLGSVVFNYAWTRENVDSGGIGFDYNDNFMQICCDSESCSDDGKDSNRQQTNCFMSCVCFCEMRTNLEFTRFCLKCKSTFLRYFVQKLHLIEKNLF